MAAKFDKEMMKKQHFWLLLIPLFIGLLLAWLGLFFGVADATQAKADENEAEKKKVDNAKAQSKKTLELYDKRKEELFGLRTQRWKEMWENQQSIYEWPTTLGEEQIAKVQTLKFGADIADPQFIQAYRDEGMKGYEKLAETVAPIQFNGDWRTALRTVPSWKRNPASEDIWLATEDYWVQRELLLALAQVNKDGAHFKRPTDFPQNDPRQTTWKNEPQERTFIGRTWQLELKLTNTQDGPMIEGFITNLTPRLQPYNASGELHFNVKLSEDPDARPFLFAIEGTSQEGGKREKIKPIPRKHTVREGRIVELVGVEQVFDTRTAPVKRVERVALGQVSDKHRMADLQMTEFSKKLVEADAAAAGTTTGGAGEGGGISMPSPAGGGSGSGPPAGILPGGPGAGATPNSPDFTFNGLARKRYVNITGQVRAMPVGLVVVADQGYVQDVLTAMTNSKLRFQTVQSTLARFRGSLSYAPQSGGLLPPPAGGETPSVPTPGGMGEGEGGGPPPPGPMPPRGEGETGVLGPPGSRFGPGSFFGGGPASSSDDQTAGNLIELAIYGIASLYEKFEAEPKKDDTGTTVPGTAPATTPGKGPMDMPPVDLKATEPMPPVDPKATKPGTPETPPTPPKK